MTTNAFLGTSSIAGIEVVHQLPTDGTPTIEIGKILIQIVVAIATLWKMFKKPKQVEN